MPQRKPAFIHLIENYFSFSRSQRRAMAAMLILGLIMLGYLYRQSTGQSNDIKEPFVTTEVIAELLVKDTGYTGSYVNNNPARSFASRDGYKSGNVTPSGSLFYFDPNSATQEQLLALGLREKTAQNIINYRNKGGRFRKPEDLSKLYSLKPEEAERLIPYVRIEDESASRTYNEGMAVVNETPVPRPVSPSLRGDIAAVDINRADSITWMVLPGIGAKRASSILRYKERLGGFISIAQVGETFGLPDSVFQKIRPSLTLGSGNIEQLSINTATEAELKAHPYIGWQIAKIIVAYRNQHGAYKSVDDLQKIYVIKKEWLEMVKPYLKAD